MKKDYSLLMKFVSDEVPKVAEETDRNNVIPAEFLQRMKEIGLFSLSEYSLRQVLDLVRAAARSSPAIANLLMSNLMRLSFSKLMDKRFDDCIFSLSITEPGGGTDIRGNLLTTATDKENGEATVNGEKVFSGIAQYASHFIVLANGSKGPTVYLVKKQEGVEVSPIEITGFRGTGLAGVRYKNAIGELLGVPGNGLKEVLQSINFGRVMYGVMALGIVEGAMSEASSAIGKRIFGKSLAEYQSVKWMFAEMEIKRRQLESLIELTLQGVEKNNAVNPVDAAIIKSMAGEVSQRATWIAVQLSGGRGLKAYGTLDRLSRDARVLDIGEGAKEVILDFIGESVIRSLSKGQGSQT